ncbi:chromatin assembly factor 1 subunit B [Nematocida minor]|uniref:chromatin assembly factor 1 subunit B n=1 Tax=Nematocida minor TaxID=1912983 RepID=UPI0022210872|nr:chromatin assembly factor 1 subunit B [Nematocida minor]KAI5189124.1 chromatin assembly factor 1 subunit B [Nematocida minor]
MKTRCTVIKLNLQFHEESAIFSVDTMEKDGKTIIATAGGDKAVRLWEYEYTGEEPKEEFEYKTALSEGCKINHIFTLVKHKGSVNTLQFSRDGRYLITGGDTGTVFLWDMEKILQSTSMEEDKKYEGQPVLVREADNSDIYEVKWFNDRIIVGTSTGRVEQYTITHPSTGENEKTSEKESGDKENSASKEKKANASSVKIRVIEEYAPTVIAKCISSKQSHKDVVQGIACTDKIFATFGNDRVVKIFSESGKIIQKLSKRSLITDKHTLFFRRLSFTEDGSLYLPSGAYEGKHTVHLLSPPGYTVTQTIQAFPSSTVCTHSTTDFLVVSEGRNVYLFSKPAHTLLFRILDCAFLPITDIKTIRETRDSLSLIISSSDGFLTNIIIFCGVD